MKKKTNTFDHNYSFYGLMREIEAKTLPKSKFYRNMLEKYINKSGEIVGTYIRKEKKLLYGRTIDFVLLRDVKVIRVENQKVTTDIIDHIWLQTTSKFISGNIVNKRINCIGKFHEYPSHHKRNIGFKIYKIKNVTVNNNQLKSMLKTERNF